MNKYVAAFAYLLAGTFLMTASWRAGLGLILTSGWAGIGPDSILFLGINLLGLYLAGTGLWFYMREAQKWIMQPFKRASKK
jgi:hypothetical protein